MDFLDSDVNTSWIEKAVVAAGFEVPKKIKIVKEKHATWSDRECIEKIEGTLELFGEVESFSVGEAVGGPRMFATAIFVDQKGGETVSYPN